MRQVNDVKKVGFSVFLAVLLLALLNGTAFAAQGEAGTVTASTLNLRESPSTQSAVLGKLAQGQKLTIIAELDEFYSVLANAQQGYVAKQYVRKKSDEVLKKYNEDVYFFDDTAQAFKTIEKSFYWGTVAAAKRQFDAGVDDWALQMNEKGDWVVSDKVNELTKKLGQKLFQSKNVRATIVFGQYYPYKKDKAGKTYAQGIHEAIDFAGPARNAPFYAVTDGVVTVKVQSKTNQDYQYIGVKTGAYTVFYIHGSKYFVDIGDKVRKGQKIGLQGDIGSPGAFHVHLEVDEGDAKTFKRSKNTVLENKSPYAFWLDQIA